MVKILKRVLVILVLLVIIITLVVQFDLSKVINFIMEGDLDELRSFIVSFGNKAVLVSFILIIILSFLPFVPLGLVFIANADVLGPLLGFSISWLSSLIDLYICFILSRYLGGSFKIRTEKSGILSKISLLLDRYGRFAVLYCRVIPFVSQRLASYAFGISRISWQDYLLGTAIGQIPAILFYSYVGSRHLLYWEYLVYFLTWIVSLTVLVILFEYARTKHLSWLKSK